MLEAKLQELARLLRTSARVVFHTGAGLSTAAGIPDFRGPRGVWTLQKKGQAVEMNMRYEDAVPTRAHMLIGEMVQRGVVAQVVSQNGEVCRREGSFPDVTFDKERMRVRVRMRVTSFREEVRQWRGECSTRWLGRWSAVEWRHVPSLEKRDSQIGNRRVAFTRARFKRARRWNRKCIVKRTANDGD